MDNVRQTSPGVRASGSAPIAMDNLPESLERILERVMGTWHGRTSESLLEIRERTRESCNLIASNGQQIHDLQEMNGHLYKKIKQQVEDLKILREEVIVKLANQAEDLRGLKHELARLREAMYYYANSAKEESRPDSSSWNRLFKRD